MASSSTPVIASSPSLNIPSSFAIAEAVITWSPVIITGFIPAFLQTATACFASGLGGSIIPTRPIKIKSFSNASGFMSFGTLSINLYATAITLRALLLIT